MANPEHVSIVKQGREAIDEWREEHPKEWMDLEDADLQGADLYKADLEGATLSQANLQDARLQDANLQGANLRKANLQGATLGMADLQGANLIRANLEGAELLGASLKNTDLRGGQGLRLDYTGIRGAHFLPRAPDPWSVVRRNYTGALMAFNLIFLAAFMAPYLFRAGKWELISRFGETLGRDAISGDSWPLWQLLLGFEKRWWYALSGILLVTYNVLRAILTWWSSQLRDAEERSGWSPSWKSYRWCYWAHHHFMRYVFWFAVGSFVLHFIPWLLTPISIPKGG